MYRLWIENENVAKYELTNNPNYDVTDVDGLLPPEVLLSDTVLSNMDGSVLSSARVKDRQIAITIKPKFPVEENRQRLYNYFKSKKLLTIFYKNENRDVRINGYLDGKPDGSLFEISQTIVFYIRCFDPFFKNRLDSIINMSQVIDAFEFPFMIEKEGIPFSVIDKALTQNVYNAGDTETGLIIELSASGEVVNPIIYNADTRERFGINITMQYGDTIRINTNKSKQEITLVRYGETRNIINSIQKGNKWFLIQPGDNLFTYSCTSGDQFLNIKFMYETLYEGV